MKCVFLLLINLVVFGTFSTYAEISSQDPCCGIYSLYTVILLNGGHLNLDELIVPQYVNNTGSSMQQLLAAAEHFGEHPSAYKNLSVDDLRQFEVPVILHVKSEPAATSYNHYYVLLGIFGRSAKIFNPPSAPYMIPTEQLARDWDGNAIIILPPRRSNESYLAAMYGHLVLKIIGVLAIILVMRWCARVLYSRIRANVFKLFWIENATLCAATLVIALSYQRYASNGLLRNTSSWLPLKQAYISSFAEKLDIAGLNRALARGAVVIDARLPSDFALGHIPGAISVPVTADDAQRHAIMASIPINREIVLYCQSKGCPFSGRVASSLAGDGYDDIKIFSDGWVAWEHAQGR